MPETESETIVLPRDHPQRLLLAAEVHARPPERIVTPSRASYVAVVVDHERRSAEFEHVARLCKHFGVEPPSSDAPHFSADVGETRLKWERHGEFSGYTFIARGSSPTPFSDPTTSKLPGTWLADIPGATIFAAHAEIARMGAEAPDAEHIATYFDGAVVVGSEVGGGAGQAYTDFRIHAEGFGRFLILDRRFTQPQVGRMVQRLFEIETYRMMALLALPIARQQSPRVTAVERSLAKFTGDIASNDEADEALQQQLTRLAAELESSIAASQFRFGACRAYHDLVITRISELREQRLQGIQTIEEFMVRRFTPAAATCASVSQRLHDVSERVTQASALLSTRVEIAREKQNQALLASMNNRAKLQLRLQQTVEVLSVIPITYYVSGLVGYAAKALKAVGLHVDPDMTVGGAIPILLVLVLWAVSRAHHRIMKSADADEGGVH